MSGCFGEGGINLNEQQPGSGDDGVLLALGDIAVHPDGSHLLARSDDKLIRADIETGVVRELQAVPDPDRVAFDPVSNRIFVTSRTTEGDRLIAYDTQTQKTHWSISTDILSGSGHDLIWGQWMPRLAPTDDGELLVATHSERVEVYEPSSGELIHSLDAERTIVDVDLSPDSHTAYFTLNHEWEDDSELPETLLDIVDLDAGTTTTISVPNCSSELMIAHESRVGFIAPTTCQKDPVSVIDLETKEFVKNLPGFGPVALPMRSKVALAFADTTNLDMSLFGPDDPVPSLDDGRFLLLFIYVETLAFDFLPVGDELPRFAMAPEGDLLVVDSDIGWFGIEGESRIRLLDINSKELIPVDGPDVELDNYSWAPDAQAVWLLYSGLFKLSIPDREIREQEVGFWPTNLNMTPDGERLILREDSTRLWVFDTEAEQLTRSIELHSDNLAGG